MRDQILLLITNICLGLAINLGVMFAVREYPAALKKSMQIWSWAGLWAVLTWIMLALRFPLATLMALAALGMSFGEFRRGMSEFIRSANSQPALSVRSSWLIAAVFLGIGVVFTLNWPRLDLRVIAISLASTVSLILIAQLTWKAIQWVPNSGRLTFVIVCSLMALQLTRVVHYSLLTPFNAVPMDWLSMAIVAASTAGYAMLAFGFCLMCNERLNSELNRAVRFDSLTGAWNRAPWRAELERKFAQSTPFFVAMFDLDNFKQVNDRFGHAAGDAALQAVIACAHKIFGPSIGRLGGEEFAVTFGAADQQAALEAVEQFRRAVSELPITDAEATFQVTVSIGVADRGKHATASGLLKTSDDAMYQAKRSGRNCVLMA